MTVTRSSRVAAAALAGIGVLALASGAAQGATGSPAESVTRVAAKPTVVTANGYDQATARCPAGSYATGGGFKINNWDSSNGSPVFAEESHPTADGTGWYAKLYSIYPKITVYAVCSP